MIVLSASQPLKDKPELADDGNMKRKDIVNLYSGSRQVWIDCCHDIPLAKPEPIIAILLEPLAGSAPAMQTAPLLQPDKRGVKCDLEN